MHPITRQHIHAALAPWLPIAYDAPAARRDDRYDDDRTTPSQIGRGPGVILELLGEAEALHFITLGIALTPEQPAQVIAATALAGPLCAAIWPHDAEPVAWYSAQAWRLLLSAEAAPSVTHPARPIRLSYDKARRLLLFCVGVWDD